MAAIKLFRWMKTGDFSQAKGFRHFTKSLSLLAVAMSVLCPECTFCQTPEKRASKGQVIDVPEVVTKAQDPHPAPQAATDPGVRIGPRSAAPALELRTMPSPSPASRSGTETNSPGAEKKTLSIPGIIRTAAPVSAPSNSLNSAIVAIVNSMPHGGGYSVQSTAKDNLINSVRSSGDGMLEIVPSAAKPSFCSSATYLVFLQAISNLEKSGELTLTNDLRQMLLVGRQADGVGIWGRWNSNGPGTAKLFHDLGIGVNFTDPRAASPGDFLKIWWTDQIGAREKGHSVIYLGTGIAADGEAAIRYWSSNSPGGYGEGSAPVARIKHMLFSRLKNVQALKSMKSLPPKDPYLSSMLKVDESYQSVLKTTGVIDGGR